MLLIAGSDHMADDKHVAAAGPCWQHPGFTMSRWHSRAMDGRLEPVLILDMRSRTAASPSSARLISKPSATLNRSTAATRRARSEACWQGGLPPGAWRSSTGMLAATTAMPMPGPCAASTCVPHVSVHDLVTKSLSGVLCAMTHQQLIIVHP